MQFINVRRRLPPESYELWTGCTHPNMKRSGEVVQIGLDEADVFQPELSAPTLGPDQRLLLVLYKDDLQEKK